MKIKKLIWLRRFTQLIFLGLFLFLLIESRLPIDVYEEYSLVSSTAGDLRIKMPIPFFFQLDPLIAISSLLSGHILIKGFILAFIILLITLILGRFFCGFICPMGSINHIAGKIRPALKGRKMIAVNSNTYGRRVKYFLLILVLAGSIIGLNLAGIFDPISLLFRSLALSIIPAVGNGIKEFFEFMAGSDIKMINLTGYAMEVILTPIFGYEFHSFRTAWLIGILFLIILFMNRLIPRFWCRVLCPLGALLGLLSRFSPLILEKDSEKCTQCGLCIKECQGAASPKPGTDWDKSECLLCLNCYSSCPEDALAFRFKFSNKLQKGPDMGRRALLGGLLAGLSLPLLGSLDGFTNGVSGPGLIRPPGSLNERDFLRLCQRCGLCMKVCPTNVISPALGEAGMSGLWTPYLVMRHGYCDYGCTLCGSVCPTGAIKEITGKEKIGIPIRIGSAYVDRGRCLPWSGNGPCIVCEEHCPTSPKAIKLLRETVRQSNGDPMVVQLPYVDLKSCIGCGICEYKCPIKGRPAIRVISAGESRSVENQILL